MKEENNQYLELCMQILESFDRKKQDSNLLSPLNLAYIGDAVYEVIIRTVVLEEGNTAVNKLNAKVRTFVKAQSQALLMHALLETEILTEKEKNIYKRGRNAKSNTSAKNASLTDYRIATGLEALVGYLYLEGETERILELIKIAIEQINWKL